MKTTIDFANGEIVNVANVLSGYHLKGKASLARTWLVKKLADKNKCFEEDKTSIQKKYFKTDKNGDLVKRPKTDELILMDGKNDIDAQQDFSELVNEKIGIDFNEYSERMKALHAALTDYDYELSGSEAEVYARVMDELDIAFSKKEGK